METSDDHSMSDALIKIAGEHYVSAGQLTNEILQSLYLVHGKNVKSALALIDEKKVSQLKCSSGRTVITVAGNSGFDYILLPSAKICQCQAFKFKVLNKKDQLMCKHILAAKLAITMEEFVKKEVSDDEMVDIMLKY